MFLRSGTEFGEEFVFVVLIGRFFPLFRTQVSISCAQ